MPKFRKKPVVIQAWPAIDVWIAARNDWASLPEPIAEAYEQGGWVFLDDGSISIPTLEGAHLASSGDWIIRGVKGEFYPCKPEIFAMTYDLA